jgi:predicted dehydrogenase
MSVKPMKIGIVGCGVISDSYFSAGQKFPVLEIAACADLDRTRAEAKAQKWGIAKACSVDELMADPAIELVINLTVPQAHGEIARRALNSGKHTYAEKPFADTREEAAGLVALAREKKLRIGCAPDTQLCSQVQSARALIDGGLIGRPIAVHGFQMMGGHECWHPSPEFYYLRGGGPMLDLGPYYLAAMLELVGPVARVCGVARRTWPTRTITSEPKKGTVIPVEIETHLGCVLDFACGAVGMMVSSFDIRTAYTVPPFIEVLGETGSIQLQGDNKPLKISTLADHGKWRESPLTHPYLDHVRGVGVADMVTAIRSGRPHRASGEFARHTLEIMLAAHQSGNGAGWVPISPCERSAPMAKLPDYTLDP